MLVDSTNGAFEVKYNFYTLYLYEQEFGTDLIKDLYGESAAEGDGIIASVNWTSLVKAIWAGAKCANPLTPRFQDWASTVGSIALIEVSDPIVAEINKELFRLGVAAAS